jgi:hypothetical protein
MFSLIAATFVIVKHRANIERLLHGNENRLKDTSAMLLLTKTVHVLALGLWFGTIVFFTLVVAVVLLNTFQALGQQPVAERPAWLPVTADLDPDKALRLFGFAIGPLFPWFFLVQGVCGLLALGTALGLPADAAPKVHKVRIWVLAAALATVVGGWPLTQKVSQLRLERYSVDAAVAKHARDVFNSWHTYSLLLAFITMILVGVGMALAAQLPTEVLEARSASKETS